MNALLLPYSQANAATPVADRTRRSIDGEHESPVPGRAVTLFKGDNSASSIQLSPEALDRVAELRQIDARVRQHEQAHLAAAADLANGLSYTYEKGPDGVNYAIAGEVSIDVSPGRTPQETLERAKRIQSAALAPADPSGPDRAVAASALQLAQQARSEISLAKFDRLESPDVARQRSAIERVYGMIDKFQRTRPLLDVYA